MGGGVGAFGSDQAPDSAQILTSDLDSFSGSRSDVPQAIDFAVVGLNDASIPQPPLGSSGGAHLNGLFPHFKAAS